MKVSRPWNFSQISFPRGCYLATSEDRTGKKESYIVPQEFPNISIATTQRGYRGFSEVEGPGGSR